MPSFLGAVTGRIYKLESVFNAATEADCFKEVLAPPIFR